ncbi:MAG: hypothetical protein GC154_06615 [bacterium]|nr:hypothetical protein [bacterium]
MKNPFFVSIALTFFLAAPIQSLHADVIEFTIFADQTAGGVKPLLGVNAGPYQIGDLANPSVESQYRDLGVNWIRTHDFYGPLDMKVMYPDDSADPDSPSSYDFSESDARMEAIVNNGHSIYFRLGDSYNEEPTPPANLAHYVKAAVNVIRHYTEGLWNGYSYDIPYIEIGNEPGNAEFWSGTRIEFFQLYHQTASALKTRFPQIKIGGCGFLPLGYYVQDETNYPRAFLEYCQANGSPLDFLSWHLYTNTPADYREAARFYRNLLDSYGYTNAENHITEWNTEEGPLRYNAQGAAAMTGAWIGLQDGGVDLSTFYRGQDTSMDLPTFFGLLYADGTYKKVAYAFKAWSRLAHNSIRVQLDGTTETTSAIAAKNESEDSIRVLLTHYSIEDATDTIDRRQITIQNLPPDFRTFRIQRSLVSSSQDLTPVEDRVVNLPPAAPNVIVLPAMPFPVNSVELIEITKSEAASIEDWLLRDR